MLTDNTELLTTVIIRDSVLCQTISDPAPASTVGIKEVKEDYSLFQNYPNPSNGITSIVFSLNRLANEVFVEIYDSKGSLILKKDFGKRNKGNYSEALNLNLSNGVYYYSLNVDGIRKSRYMLIE